MRAVRLPLALSCLAALAACGTGGPAGPDVLVVTVDTLRADRLGSHGYALPTTPRLDALASAGVRFADCSVQWPKTWPSMASFLTGQYPKTTGIRLARRRLPDEHVLLSELFAEAGYRTAAVVANFNVGRTFGFDQGFEHFVESWQERWSAQSGAAEFVNAPGLVKLFTNAETVTDQALAWLGELDADEPFFLWLHYMDPHGPYLPPAKYASLFQGAHPPDEVPLELIPDYQRQRFGGSSEPISDVGFYRAQYDREVRHFDDELGRLLDGVDALERGAVLTVVAADHGESLGEHDYYLEHGKFSYQVNAHTPLVMHLPGVLPAGHVVRAPVGMIDVAPTLLDLAGLAQPPFLQGRSLARLARGSDERAGAPQHVFMESGHHEDEPQLTVRRGPWKLILVQSKLDRAEMTGAAVELYDLAADPGETRNVAGEHPELAADLLMTVTQWYAQLPLPAVEPAAVEVEGLAGEALDMLKALGYHE